MTLNPQNFRLAYYDDYLYLDYDPGDLDQIWTLTEKAITYSCYQSIGVYVNPADPDDITIFFPMFQDVGLTMLSQVYNTKGKVYVSGQGMVQYGTTTTPLWSWIDDNAYGMSLPWMEPSAHIIGPNYYSIVAMSNYTYDIFLITIRNGIVAYNLLLAASEGYNDGRYYADAIGRFCIPINSLLGTDVLVSSDFGVTCNQFNATDSVGVTEDIIADSNNVLWLFVVIMVTLNTQYKVRVCKSIDYGASWLYVNEIMFTTGKCRCKQYIDGTDIYVMERAVSYPSTLTYPKLYKSVDGGVTFTVLYTWPTAGNAYGFAVESGVICVFLTDALGVPYISRSVDGITWVTAWQSARKSWPFDYGGYDDSNMKMDVSGSVWTVTNYQMHRIISIILNGVQYWNQGPLAFLMSTDYGLTWTNVDSPTIYGENSTSIQYTLADNTAINPRLRTLLYKFDAMEGRGGWFYDLYTPGVELHYGEEGENVHSLLCGGGDGIVYQYAGTTDASTAIAWNVQTASRNQSDAALRKLYNGAMLDADTQSADILATIGLDNYLNLSPPITINTPTRRQTAIDIGPAGVAGRNIALKVEGSGPVELFLWESRWHEEGAPVSAFAWETDEINFDMDGYVYSGDLFLSYISTADVLITFTVDNVAYASFTLPSTFGLVEKTYVRLPVMKGKMWKIRGESTAEWQPHGDACELRVKQWGLGESWKSVPLFVNVQAQLGSN